LEEMAKVMYNIAVVVFKKNYFTKKTGKKCFKSPNNFNGNYGYRPRISTAKMN